MDKIFNTTITIESVEQKNNKLTLVAHDRKRYGFWTTKKDGTDSAPYAQFKAMGLKQGDSVYIGYVIEEYDSQYGRKESNKIINFRETNEKPVSTPSSVKSSNTGHPTASGGSFDKRITLYGMVNGRLSSGASLEDISRELPNLALLIDEINEIASRPSSMNQAQAKIYSDDLPTIQQDDLNVDEDEVDVSGIPFN